MARLKPKQTKINSLSEADHILKEIGIAEMELEAIDSQAQKEIGEIKENAVKQGEPLRKKIAELSSLLGVYAEYNKEDFFKDKKTIELTFGIFGYRKSTSISVKKQLLNF